MAAEDAVSAWVWTVEGREEALQRRARKQVSEDELVSEDGSTALHNLWTGEAERDRSSSHERSPRPTRCDSLLHSGWTRGEAMDASFCLHFARGRCARGWACEYKHRLPTLAEDASSSHECDCFGRSRTETFPNANKGAGNFQRDSKVLYVNWSGASQLADSIQGMLERDFGEWGPIWDVYVKRRDCIAFVRYSYRLAAEFAKEAMNRQTLIESGAGEALIVRWANDDPNPVAISRQKREREELYFERLERSGAVVAADPQRKVAKHSTTDDTIDYPNTTAQYPQEAQQSEGEQVGVSAFAQWWNSLSKEQRKHFAKAYGFSSSKRIKTSTPG
jgi:hypothetical protein